MRRKFFSTADHNYRHWEDELYLSEQQFIPFERPAWPCVVSDDGRNVMMARKLLVVDDEASIRNNYCRIFSQQGYCVLVASNAMEAKDLLVHEKIDAIFLDINMPEVEGDTLFEVVRAFHPEVKIIVSSVYSVEEQMDMVKSADAYYDKAGGIADLVGLVTMVVS